MVSDYFLVVVPTHRPQLSEDTINKLKNSLTYPSDFYILDGSKGKPAAINEATESLLDPTRHSIYVTVDDDIVLPENWQHFIACAFNRLPHIGICGIDMEGTISGEQYMSKAMTVPKVPVHDILFRDTTNTQNVAGGCMASRSHIAKQSGAYPLAYDGRLYHVDEDGWRCHRCKQLGYQFGYVTCPNGVVTLLVYDDTPEYRVKKQQDLDNWNQNPSWETR